MTDPKISKSESAERFVAGALMAAPGIIDDAAQRIAVDDFGHDAYRRIAACAFDLRRRRVPVSVLAVAEQLRDDNRLDDVGGVAGLAAVYEFAGVGAGWEYWADRVQEDGARRRIAYFCQEMMRDANDRSTPPAWLYERMAAEAYARMTGRASEEPVSLNSVITEVMQQVADRQDGRGIRPVSTGFDAIDQLIGGFRPGALYVLAARPSVGKSALATNFALNAIADVPALFFSQEMSRHELGARVMAIRAQVPLYAIMGNRRLRAGRDDDEVGRLVDRSNQPTAGTLWIDDRSHLTAAEVHRAVRRSVQKYGVRVVVVDYLQRMQHDKTAGDSTTRQVGETVKALKTLARTCDVPVICLAQLNRQNVNRADTKPVLSDLRDSGEIEQEADVVMMLHPEPRPDEGQRPTRESITLLIEKQRNGPTGEVKLDYVRPFTEFRNQPPAL